MTSEINSKKEILKSSSIVGGASLITILIGFAKVKGLAIILGPTGIGLLGILTSIMTTGSTLFGMGIGTSGVRLMALEHETNSNLLAKSIFSASLFMGLLAVVFFYIFSYNISYSFFDKDGNEFTVLALAIGVFFTILFNSQSAILQGNRQINELAKVKIISAILAAVLGLIIVYEMHEVGIPFFVILLPLVSFFVARYYCNISKSIPINTITEPSLNSFSYKLFFEKWKALFTLGFVFMLTGVMGMACQLAVRFIINQKLDIEAVGYFQASWTISMTYIGFILGAMAADYYPRLTQKANNHVESNNLVLEQTEIAIILAAPALFLMLTFTPIFINLLYTDEFVSATELLRLQVYGDVFKIISWPLGFILLAKGHGKIYFCTELFWNISYLGVIYIGIDFFGLNVTGYAFVFSYFSLLVFLYFITSRVNEFKWNKKIKKQISLLILCSTLLLSSTYYSIAISYILGVNFFICSLFILYKTISELGIYKSKLKKMTDFFSRN